ncbi:MAG: 5-formyltetrahydrofolate cyclo-ligase [Carnobacterium sp.]|uniref:5-formyltetrahydrofolate cyclo-ligase n=1 Tax=Carnobacterium sp. TaxID=48221 RepID=UPI002FC9D482
MTKQEIRKQIIERLKELTGKKKKEQEAAILARLFQTVEWKEAKIIATTMAQEMELNTRPIIEKAWEEGKQVVLPRAKKNRIMDFVRYTSETPMETSTFGLSEPAAALPAIPKADIDMVIVPGLAFSEKGYRVGFGGGYYDRFLADYTGNTVSLVFNEQKIPSFEIESFDIPIGLLITVNETKQTI